MEIRATPDQRVRKFGLPSSMDAGASQAKRSCKFTTKLGRNNLKLLALFEIPSQQVIKHVTRSQGEEAGLAPLLGISWQIPTILSTAVNKSS
jgi:hypothetical protein